MSIKSILVPLDGSQASFSALDTALVVADRFDAKIKAIHVRPKAGDLPYELDYVSANLKKSVIEETDKKSREAALEIQHRFNTFCDNHHIKAGDSLNDDGIGAKWYEEAGSVSEVLIRHGRLCDVIATSRPDRKKGTLLRSPAGETMESLLMRAGRPILMVPPDWRARKVGRAAVAWNESLEASRALAMTMPWLRGMDEVTVIVGSKREHSVPLLCEYLSLHGVSATVKYLPSRIKSAGPAILDCCEDNAVEMLVVGGFSHTRSRQLIFGGVTRFLLTHSNVITVMVH